MITLKTRIVSIRTKNIMKRNHARQALNDKIHVVFFAALTRNNVSEREKAFRVLVQPLKTKNLCTEVIDLACGSRGFIRSRWTKGEKMTPSLLRILPWKEPLTISWQTFSATWMMDDGHLK